jgi:hypothetical protein
LKLYFAGTESEILGQQIDFGIKKYLVSFAAFSDVSKFKEWYKIAGFPSKKKELFLDCGAFSNKEKTTNVVFTEYLDFVQRFHDKFDVIASFDVIGDAEASLNNYKDMIALGLDVIPTWHYTEPIEYFDNYCKMTDYVAVGGVAKLSFRDPALTESIVRKTLRRKPKETRIHLFGIGAPQIMTRYGHELYSVDNSKWNVARFSLVVNRQGKDSFRYYELDGKRITNQQVFLLRQYNIRRFQELENDINSSIPLLQY